MWLAETVDPSSPLTWVNLGVLGLLAVAAIRGLIWFSPAVTRVLHDADTSRAESGELNRFIREVVVPAMAASTEAMKDAHDAAVRSGTHQIEVTDALEEVRRSIDRLREEQQRVLDELRRRCG